MLPEHLVSIVAVFAALRRAFVVQFGRSAPSGAAVSPAAAGLEEEPSEREPRQDSASQATTTDALQARFPAQGRGGTVPGGRGRSGSCWWEGETIEANRRLRSMHAHAASRLKHQRWKRPGRARLVDLEERE